MMANYTDYAMAGDEDDICIDCIVPEIESAIREAGDRRIFEITWDREHISSVVIISEIEVED